MDVLFAGWALVLTLYAVRLKVKNYGLSQYMSLLESELDRYSPPARGKEKEGKGIYESRRTV